MKIIKHRFINHRINPETEILILGTFNPDTEKNEADFFYGRRRNYLWQILSDIYKTDNLKFAPKKEKLLFMEKMKIDFIDLIRAVKVEEGQENNYKDDYIDGKVIEWNDVPAKMKALKNLRKIALTRKTLHGIPNMKKRIEEIERYCRKNNIVFRRLATPARHPNYYGAEKYAEWFDFFLKD